MRTALLTAVCLLALGARQAQAQQTINCTDYQTSLIAGTQVWAGLMLLTTGSYLGDLRAGGDSARFDYWYGSHSDVQINYVDNLAAHVYNVMDDTTFNCECTEEEDRTRYGFVRPDDPPNHLRFCKLFFDATDFVGDNVTTFVHELSHFFGTRDCMDPNLLFQCPLDADMTPNSAEKAHAFAVSDPNTSTFNAYNWEHFVTDLGRQ
jgi:hypothetical protein